jgi:hypothetical protein
MKRNVFILAAAIMLSQLVHAQTQTIQGALTGIRIRPTGYSMNSSLIFIDSTLSKEDYLQKSKNQNTAGWIMLGGGVALSIIGTIGFNSTYDLFVESSAADAYAFMIITGTGLSLGSIPLFIASRRNHKKAANLSFKSQHIYIPQQNSFVFKSQPALSLVIPL